MMLKTKYTEQPQTEEDRTMYMCAKSGMIEKTLADVSLLIRDQLRSAAQMNCGDMRTHWL
jgi:hypothetical protein